MSDAIDNTDDLARAAKISAIMYELWQASATFEEIHDRLSAMEARLDRIERAPAIESDI